MNLVWNRDIASKEPQKDMFAANARLREPHWAEIILERLNQPEDLALAIRQAYPHEEFPEIFEIVDIHHIPGHTLKIIIQFEDLNQKNNFTIIHIIFYPHTECLEQYYKAKAQAIVSDRIAVIDSWDAVAYIFPEDNGLPNLSEMLDMNNVAEYLGEPRTGLSGASWKMLSYQAGIRCAFSYRFHKSGNNYFGKIQNNDEAEYIHKLLLHLWHSPTRRFKMAQPIAYNPILKARWETFIIGKNLETAIQDSDLQSIINLVVTNLIYLHQQDDIPSLPLATPDKLTNLIHKRVLRRMRSLIPSLAGRAEKICDELINKFHYATDHHIVTLHGDFHIANFLLNEKDLIFLDLDNLCEGSPCYDLALFGSRLILRNLLNNDRLPETLQLIANLPALYTKLSGREISRSAFAWYLAAYLLARQIKVCMSNAAPNMEYLAGRLLDWSEDCINNIESPAVNLR